MMGQPDEGAGGRPSQEFTEPGNAPGSSNPEEEGESSVGLLEWAGRNLFDEE